MEKYAHDEQQYALGIKCTEEQFSHYKSTPICACVMSRFGTQVFISHKQKQPIKRKEDVCTRNAYFIPYNTIKLSFSCLYAS